MKEYSLSKYLVKRYKVFLVFISFISLMEITLWLFDTTSPYKWFPIILKVLGLISYVGLVIYYIVNIREPGIKIGDEKIEVRIDQGLNFWKITWANLSHIEVKTEHIDNITGDQNYEYVCFKQPVTRDFNVLGLKLWKMSKKGFRLDIFDESAVEEIKARLS
ncbi:MAG: hypothetical protein ACOY0R_12685 [Chloroflexota bacterium]